MIRKYDLEDRQRLCDFFAFIIEGHKEYISHGELQMGVATDAGVLAPDYKEKWLLYLDRQASIADNTILLSEEDGQLAGFIIFGVVRDGNVPYGVVFDLSVSPELRGKRIGVTLLQKATESFRQRGISDCYLESGVNNHSAHDFFRHYGFSQVSDIFRMKL